MGKVVAQAIMSLDGYVAKQDNTIGRLFDWLQNGEVATPTPAGATETPGGGGNATPTPGGGGGGGHVTPTPAGGGGNVTEVPNLTLPPTDRLIS